MQIPLFPTTYAQAVVDHAARKQRRHKRPSAQFLEERNPRKALRLAQAVLNSPDGIIRDRLLKLQQYLPGQQQLTYDFAACLAGYTNPAIVPQGFIMAAVLALHDIQVGTNGYTGKPIRGDLVGQMPVVYKLLELEIPIIAKAIFPADFAGEVQTTMDEIHALIKERQEARDALLPKPEITGDPLQIYTAARRIADLAFEVCDVDDRRNQGVNALYHQTTGGLFIEQYYGIPGSIWTPWGEWDCWGSGSGSDKSMQEFLAAIGEVELFAPVRHTAQGSFGPVYAVLKVGDITLPKPEIRQGPFIKYEEANALWAQVEAQYKITMKNQQRNGGEKAMSKAEVVSLMESSKSEKEWNANCDKVKRACGGYPDFWYSAIITSGVLAKTQASW